MAENLLMNKYKVSPVEVYKRGPYLHSVAENFIGLSYTIPELRKDTYLLKLQSHLQQALKMEQEFYDEVGVVDADDFSNKYLYGFDQKTDSESDEQKIIKIIQKILININSTLALASRTAKEKLRPTLEKVAKKIVEAPQNQEMLAACREKAKNSALGTLKEFLNDNIKNQKAHLFINEQSKSIQLPQRQLSSDLSHYVLEILCEHSPQLRDEFKLTPQQKINRYKSFFFTEAKKEGLAQDDIEFYWRRLNTELLSLKTHKNQTGSNLSAFSNMFGAEGALGEIAIQLTLEDVLGDKGEVKALANAMVHDKNRSYSLTKGAQETTNRTYKSPTDLVIKINGKEYRFQVKTSYSQLTADKQLKLQGGIALSTLLGNLVSGGYMSDDTAKLLIYTMANLSTQEFHDKDGINDKIDLVLRILQMCMEYFAESTYSRELDDELNASKIDPNNKGNMFFIYSGKLIPMSSFIKAAIAAMEGENLVLTGNYFDKVTYDQTYSINEIRSHDLNGRISLGEKVYNKTKIRELSFVIAKMDENIARMVKN